MRFQHVRTLSIAAAMLMTAAGTAQSQTSSDADGWKTIIYPIHAWLPIFGADVRLPPQTPPGGGSITIPSAEVSGNFDGAALAGFRVERARVSVEGEFLWAGMSGSVTLPRFDLDLDTITLKVTGGFRVAPDLYIDAGVHHLAVKMNASILDFAPVEWKPGIWEPLVGATFRPYLKKNLRVFAHTDFGFGDKRSASASARLEWKPFPYFAIGGGWGWMYVKADGTIRDRDIHFNETLNGPVFTLGIPF
jgi:hypothetical protein